MSIKCFLFDCGGVVLQDGDLSAYALWEERLGLGAGELAERLWQGELWHAAASGELTDAEFWSRSGAELGLVELDQIAALREDLWGTWDADPDVLAVVDALRPRHQVAMLSNATDAIEILLAERYGIADRFTPILNSARLGLTKPDPAIFELAIARLNVAPGEILFIDDRAENVAAAASAGMHVLWFVGGQELVRQLAPYLGTHKQPDPRPSQQAETGLLASSAAGQPALAD